jgi:hypothetical protein
VAGGPPRRQAAPSCQLSHQGVFHGNGAERVVYLSGSHSFLRHCLNCLTTQWQVLLTDADRVTEWKLPLAVQ